MASRRFSTGEEVSKSSFRTFLAPVQDSILQLHDLIDMPWWSTIAVATIGLRVTMIPVTIFGRITLGKLFTGKALMQTMQVQTIYNQEVSKLQRKLLEDQKKGKAKPIKVLFESMGLVKDRVRGQFLIWRVNKVNPLVAFIPPTSQLFIFVVYAVSVRDLIRNGSLDLSDQGLLWFSDLQQPDPYYVLPLIAIGSSYSLIELGLKRKASDKYGGPAQIRSLKNPIPTPVDKSKLKLGPDPPNSQKKQLHTGSNANQPTRESRTPGQFIGNMFQYFLLASFPFASAFPAAVFMYWIPSTAFGLVQLKATDLVLKRSGLKSNAEPNSTNATPEKMV